MRQKVIQRFIPIVKAVIAAKIEIEKEWASKIEDSYHLSFEEQDALLEEYMRAIATELVAKTSDEELEKLYQNDNI